MTRSTLGWVLFAVWVAAMAMSFASFGAEPTGDGFTRGMNRLTGFLGWQIGAAILALGTWMAVAPLPRGTLQRWIGRVPGWWTILLVVGITALLVVIPLLDGRPPDPAPDLPVTAPVDAG